MEKTFVDNRGITVGACAKMDVVASSESEKCEDRFSNPVDIKTLFDVLFSGEWSYRRTVLGRYVHALFRNVIRIGITEIYVSYFLTAMLFLVLLALLIWKYKKRETGYRAKGIRLFVIVCVQFAVYVLGLVIMYMFKFSEDEALVLASIDRYMGIVFLSVWVILVLLALAYLQRFTDQKYLTGLLFLGLMIFVTLMQYVKTYLNRESVQDSVSVRGRYEQMCSLIEEAVPEQANVFIISQEDNGFDRLVLRYSIRPRRATSGFWSIGEAFYEDDVYTYGIDAERWMEYLVADFDYVALYRINEYFIENYGELFEEGTQIQDNMVYLVNKETGLLEFFQAE
ncbi:MAG: hypothetical protein ACI4AB_11020 [Acetatifactor sp.]